MEPWKRKLRMGMVGGGQGAFIGGVHRIAATLDGQAELMAGSFSRDPQNTRVTGEQLYLAPPRCYDTYEEMAAREAALPPDRRIDFVSIVTPNNLHFPVSRTFLSAGFHVVCDKPMTLTLEEAQELVRLVEKSGLVFALTHNYTGNALVRHARELFRSGEMGTVRKAIAEYLQEWGAIPRETEGWRADPRQAGLGGALGDIGSHAFNLLEYITGDPVTELCADTATFLPNRTLDEDANVLLRFAGGGKGLLTCSQIAAGEDNGLRIRIYASKGGLMWEQENPNYMHICRFGEPRRTVVRGHGEYLSKAATEVTRVPWGHPEGYLEAFANIYAGAIDAIRRHIDGHPMRTGEYEFPTVYDGLRGMQFITQAVHSAQAGGRWLGIP